MIDGLERNPGTKLPNADPERTGAFFGGGEFVILNHISLGTLTFA